MNKEINISILSDVIANKVIDSCNLNINKQKTIANIISEVLDEYTIQKIMPAIAKKGILYTETLSVENRVVEGAPKSH